MSEQSFDILCKAVCDGSMSALRELISIRKLSLDDIDYGALSKALSEQINAGMLDAIREASDATAALGSPWGRTSLGMSCWGFAQRALDAVYPGSVAKPN
ncbi:MAG TPA: hypothetical protein VI756_15465 [Blastocatellia bacterium]